MTKTKVYAKHVAPEGHFITGIPSKDLSEEEWNALPENLKMRALSLKHFEIVSRKPVEIEVLEEPAEEENDG